MPTPKVNGAASITQRTGGLRNPPSTEPRMTDRTSDATLAPRFGVNPRSCMNRSAISTVTASRPARITYGTPRFVAWAMRPPSTEPVSIAIPPTTCPGRRSPRATRCSPSPARASTSHASVAPEKNVKPSPSRIDEIAQPSRPACDLPHHEVEERRHDQRARAEQEREAPTAGVAPRHRSAPRRGRARP